MSYDPQDYPDPDDDSQGRIPRREGGLAIDLTSMGVRLAATAIVIGLGVIIIFFALRPRGGDGDTADVGAPQPTLEIDRSQPLETFTPGPTSTPPPLDEPTPEPTVAGDGETGGGEIAVGGTARVANTGGSGVNLRAGSGTTFDVVQVLPDDTPLEITEGPIDADGYTWWKVRLEDGTEGWLVQEFMAP